jgi:type IV pilus assembly protein PilF
MVTARMIFRFVFVVALAMTVGGCVSTIDGAYVSSQQSVSSQTAESNATQRAKVHTELGSLYLQDARYAVALEEARTAIAADSAYAPAYNLLALTHMVIGENPQAEQNFKRAINLAPGDPEISNNYGRFLCFSGQEKRSLEYFERAVRNPLYATPTVAYTNAGICQARLKEYKLAEEQLIRAQRLAPSNTEAIFWLADVTFRQAKFADARKWIGDLERLVDLSSEAVWLALRIERKLENREGELRHAAQLRKRFGGSSEQQKLLRGEYD